MGAHSTCGLTGNGSLYCWGDLLISGNYEDRGPDFIETHSYEPVLIDAGPFSRIFMTRNSLCAEETKTKRWRDRKSTRLNSSHVRISYAVFCLKKKKKKKDKIKKQK